MRKKSLSIWLVAATAALTLSSHASASVVYTSGSTNGTVNAYRINSIYAVSDQFILTSAATITGFTFGGWTYPNDLITNVTYGFSNSPDFASDGVASLLGGAALGPSYGIGFYDVRDYTATISSVFLNPGTYYFSLQNAVTSGNNGGFWDQNGSAGVSFQSNNGALGITHAFTLTSDSVPAVPEPTTWAMMLLGFAGIGFAMRRRRPSATAVPA